MKRREQLPDLCKAGCVGRHGQNPTPAPGLCSSTRIVIISNANCCRKHTPLRPRQHLQSLSPGNLWMDKPRSHLQVHTTAPSAGPGVGTGSTSPDGFDWQEGVRNTEKGVTRTGSFQGSVSLGIWALLDISGCRRERWELSESTSRMQTAQRKKSLVSLVSSTRLKLQMEKSVR